MNYLIAVLPDQMAAEQAYSALEAAEIPVEQRAIIGKGYQTAAEFGIFDPKAEAKKRSRSMSYWLIPFGFVAGYAFNLQTGINILPGLGAIGNHVLGGIFGAIAAVMGSFFIGGGFGLPDSPENNLPYKDRLKENKYLVAVKGSTSLKNKALEILRQFDPEDLQSYQEPTSA